MTKFKRIPKKCEWEQLLYSDLQSNVLKSSTSYASKYPTLNRLVIKILDLAQYPIKYSRDKKGTYP